MFPLLLVIKNCVCEESLFISGPMMVNYIADLERPNHDMCVDRWNVGGTRNAKWFGIYRRLLSIYLTFPLDLLTIHRRVIVTPNILPSVVHNCTCTEETFVHHFKKKDHNEKLKK